MRRIDYYAKLTVHGLPMYDYRTLQRLESWLKNLAKDLRYSSKEHSGRFTAKLMK